MTAPHPEPSADVLRRHLRINGLTHAADQPLVDAIAGAFAELHPEVTLLTEMSVLRLEPGDILVLTTDQHLSDADADTLGKRIRERFPGHEIALVEGMKLAVVRPSGEATT